MIRLLKKQSRTLCKFLIFIVCLNCSSVQAKDEFRAKSILIEDRKSGKVVFKKNEKEIYPIASLTKLVTAVVSSGIFRNDDVIKIKKSHLPKNPLESRADMKPGTEYSFTEILHGLLIPSGNDAARALEDAMKQKGKTFSEEAAAFLEKKDLNSTSVYEAVGLNPENRSNTEDLSKIADLTFENPVISDIIKKTEYSLKDTKGKTHLIKNRLTLNSYRDWKIYGKTGRTKKAGQCFAGIIEKDTKKYKIIFLGAEDAVSEIKSAVDFLDRN